MQPKLCIFVCQNFFAEVRSVLSTETWSDVEAIAFESRCGRPTITQDELAQRLVPGCTHVVVLGSNCLAGDGIAHLPGCAIEVHRLNQCFELVASPRMVDSSIEQGSYQITPTWLANWRKRLTDLGFDPERSIEFFQGFARDLVFYDTGVDARAPQRFQEMALALGLPSRQMPVGLDYTRHFLTRIVFDWRLKEQQRQFLERDRRHTRELADYAVAMDLLTQLAQSQTNTPVIETIEALFQMLFAPNICSYLPVLDGRPVNASNAVPDGLLQSLPSLDTPWLWTASGEGFLLSVSHGRQMLGYMVVEGLSFPQFRQRYLNLALAMVGVCALAIEQAQSKAELKIATEKLAKSQMQLLQSEKMAVIGQIAAGVAHEINNPIGFVKSNLGSLRTYVADLLALIDAHELSKNSQLPQDKAAIEGLKTSIDLDFLRQDVVELLSESREGLERVRKIVQNLRDFSRIDSDEWELADLNSGLESTLSIVLNELRPKVTVIKNYGALTPVRCQLGQINQVFLNLLVNAGQAIEQHGTITLSSGMAEAWVWVSVQDTGCGMTSDVRSRIFEPFFTTKPVGLGTGLGLALAHDIISKHHGRLEVHSELGQGSRFTVWLPVNNPHWEQRSASGHGTPASQRGDA